MRSLVASIALAASFTATYAWAEDKAGAEVAKSEPSGPARDYFADAAFRQEFREAAIAIAKRKIAQGEAQRQKSGVKTSYQVRERLSTGGGFSGFFVWDSEFGVLWARYVDGMPVLGTLDNFYDLQQADGNPKTRVYGYNVVVAGEDGTKVKKSVYARGYCMGVGYEPNNGITELEIPQAELPPGKKLTVAVRPCSSLATRGKALAATFNLATGMSKSGKADA